MSKLPENYRKKIEQGPRVAEKDPDLPDVTPEELEIARRERMTDLMAASAHDNRYQDPYEGFEEKMDSPGQEKKGEAESSLHASRQAMKKIMAGDVDGAAKVHNTAVGSELTAKGEFVMVKHPKEGTYLRRIEMDGYTVTWLRVEEATKFQEDAPELLEVIATLVNLGIAYELEKV